MGRTQLSEHEKEIITNNALNGKSTRESCNELNRDFTCIKRFLDKNNLPSNPPRKSAIPIVDCQPIYDLYLRGYTIQQIHDDFYPQYKTDGINYILRVEGITRPNGKIAVMNHNYFNSIDDDRKAYWLGFLYADGCLQIQHNNTNFTVGLELKSDDKYIIEKFRDDVESDREVRTYINSSGFQRKDGQPHETSKLILNSKTMFDDLVRLGLMPSKSLKLTTLPNIDKKYMRHFIRGFFDGNGSIFLSDKRYKVAFYSTHDFCTSLKEFLSNELNINNNKVYDQKQTKVSFISFCIVEELLKIREYLYKDTDLYLTRKYEKFQNLCQ